MAGRIRKNADERKLEIVDKAISLAGELGPDRLTTEKLASEIGISQAAIFRHFTNKNEIWYAVAERIRALMVENTVQINHSETLAEEKLVNHIVGQFEFIAKTPAIPAILFSSELHSSNAQLRAFFVAMMGQRQKLFADLVEIEIQSGRFQKDIDKEDAAVLILSLIQGLAMRWSLNSRKFDLTREGSRLLGVLIAGFSSNH